jgi:ferredoxin
MKDIGTTPAGRRVWVDAPTCIGAGNCARLARGAFRVTDEGVAEVVDQSAVDEAKLRLAERSCPTGAIYVEDRG